MKLFSFCPILRKKTWLCKYLQKKNNVWFINFSCMCHKTCFWLSDHKPVQSAPVWVKNRTWYYRGISKRPVKIKGFREVLCSSFGCCQHFFGICFLMWLVKTVSYLKSNTSRFYSRKNDWKGAWKSEAHSGSQTRTLVHLNITDKHLGLNRKLPRWYISTANVFLIHGLKTALPHAHGTHVVYVLHI